MEYNLVDMHFHTNLSYDAYENQNGIKYDISKIYKNSNVKMVCLTDHNIFDYSAYLKKESEFSSLKIKCLPGMELTIDGVHWIIIMDDQKLSKDKIGSEFSKDLLSKINIDIDKYDISDFADKEYKATDIISLLDKYGINYIAIPHLDKDKGIFKNGGVDPQKIEIFLNYIRDNIVYGFETKYHDQFFVEKINKISKNVKILEENNSDKVNHLYEQLKNINSVKKLSSAFIYGSDYHGKDNIKYIDLEKDLFYMKAECSFQGLRLALLDYDSRIFSLKRFEKYKKDTNKILEYITISINGKKEKIYFGDGLNAIIGSRGTGKSYLLRCLIGEKDDYIGSDIYEQIKIENVKIINETEKNNLDSQLDVDYISQKNSGKSTSNNIYDLLSEAPYDTDKFVKKIRKLSTTVNKEMKIEDYFREVNDCLNSYILLDNKKNQVFDYSFLSTYNSFYSASGETYKIVELIDNYVDFCSKYINNAENEINELKKFNKTLDEFNGHLEYVKKLKKYGFSDYEGINEYIKSIRKANDEKIELNNKNILRIKTTKEFIDIIKEKASKNISNEGQYYSNGFNNLSVRVKQLMKLMTICSIKSKKIKELNSKEINDKEDIIINKNNISINLTIQHTLDIKDKKISDIMYIFKNYNNIYKPNLKYIDLFENFGDKYIKEIYPYKDGRITKGEYNGYDIFAPKINPVITIEYNGQKKDIAKLSPGEKADILLDLILDPNSNKILIIDQPEDDLDNETIFKKVVLKLRSIKMRRQVLIISHNANLVINGDSDSILICIKDNNEYRVINDSMESLIKYDYSSINTKLLNDTILNISTHILDGGKDALSMRVKKIGYKDIFLEEDNNGTSI